MTQRFKTSLKDGDPELAKEFDVKLNGITPDKVSIAEEKVKRFWRCKTCDYSWEARVRQRSRLHTGCPNCSGQVCIPHINSLAITNPSLASEWHPSLNGDKTPYDFKAGSNTYVWWLCKDCSWEWEASINTRNSQSTGCPECAKKLRTSFPEKAIYFYLKQVFPSTKSCYKIDGVEADIFVPEANLVIEYDGILYHQYKVDKDRDKNNFFKDFNMIRVRETGLPTIPDYGCYNFLLDPQNKEQFKSVIVSILQTIISLGVEIKGLPDIDIKRDAIAIKSLTTVVEVENSFAFKRPDLVYLWDTSGVNGDLTPENVYGNALTEINWVCPRGHKFMLSLDRMSHIKQGNTGCPYCSSKQVLRGFNDLATTHPLIAQEYNINLDTGRQPTEVTSGCQDLVQWICVECGDPFTCKIGIRTGKWAQDCPNCQGKKKNFRRLKKLYLDNELIGIRFLYGRRYVDIDISTFRSLEINQSLDTVARDELLPHDGSFKTLDEIERGLVIPDYSNDPTFIKRLINFYN